MSGNQMILLGGSQAPAVDPFFYSVTSLLHGDGTNGGQNNTFLDSSTNNFTITRNGNTTQGSFSPFSQTGWSNYFDGTGDYLTVADNTALDMGSSNFTIEGWYYPVGNASVSTAIFSKRANSGTVGGVLLYYGGSGLTPSLLVDIGGSWAINTASSVSFVANQWNHFAVVRNGSAFNLYINGVSGVSASNAGSIPDNASAFAIGAMGADGSGPISTCYISNFRVVKGTAVYTAAFTPPTTPLTAITNTSLLTCQSNRFIDNSTNAFAITRNGDVSVQPFSPFNPTTPYSTSSIGGSGYFDGSGDRLSIAGNSAFDISSGDFTVEGWVYPTSSAAVQGLFVLFTATNANYAGMTLYVSRQTSSVLLIEGASPSIGGGSAAFSITTTNTAPVNTWTHVAVTRNSNTFTVWINGVSSGTATFSGTLYWSPPNLYIGSGNDTSPNPFAGYISNFRLVKGTAVYTAGFTPPTLPVTAISGTQVLTNFTNGAIFDNAAVADYETVGNAQISTSVKKYGTGSMAFDGTGDYLTTPYSQSINFGTGDFTIEGWFYLNSFANQYYVLGGTWTTGTTDEWLIQIENNGSLRFLTTANTSFFATGLIKTGTWYHFAASRSAGVIKAYINGSVFATITNANSIGSVSKTLNIGQQPGGTWPWNGYLDDWRVTKGIGRYPYNFTPPTAEFPNIGGTVTLTADPYFDYTTLLLPGNGTNGAQNNTFLDSSTNAFTITRNGNTTQGTFSPFSQTGWGNYFDGTGDYLSIADNTALDMGSSDFTIECWVYPVANQGGSSAIFGKKATGSTYGGVLIYFPNTGLTPVVLATVDGSSWGINFTSSISMTLNQWYHLALTRSGSTWTIYVNGTSGGSASLAGTIPDNSAAFTIGAGAANGELMSAACYISNFRVVKGTAVYTSNFTPSTTPLTAITNTSLLTCQSNRFIDNSTNAFAITRNGDVSVQAFSPFNPTAAWSASTNGGSGYFDGSGDYLNTSSTQVIPSGSFTVEAWVYLTTTSSAVTVVAQGTSGTAGRFSLGIESSLWWAQIGGATINAGTPVTNNWTHLAVTFNGSTLTLYVNGVSVGTASTSTNAQNTTLRIGSLGPVDWSTYYWPGYIGQVRVSNTVRSISVPTTLYTADANTTFLANYTNAGIYDATSKNDLETVGNAQISTTQSKFGGSSMYFDGTGDYLRSPYSPNFQMNTGDFTVEFWVYLVVANDYGLIFNIRNSTAQYSPLQVYIRGTRAVEFYSSTNGSTNSSLTSSTLVPLSTWTHVAVVRYSGTVKIYINGIADANTLSLTGSLYLDTTWGNNIGGESGGNDLNAYLQDLRVTKGIARYTSNFTPPTTAFLTL